MIMVEVVVVANVQNFKVGQRILLADDSPLLRTGYFKMVNHVVPSDITADPAGVLPESKKKVTRGKSRLESGGKSESGTPERDRGSSEGSDTVSSGDEGSGTGR
jgi:hypothetical protein